jgi:hypothetical protein
LFAKCSWGNYVLAVSAFFGIFAWLLQTPMTQWSNT